MALAESLPRLQNLSFTIFAAGISLLTPGTLLAQSADQKDIDALKAQMQQMQTQYEQRMEAREKQYEQRIESMESKIKALESKAAQGSILNTRVLTDSNGTEWAGKEKGGPLLDESFLKSLTRYFTFTTYIRTGVGFNGNGGPQDFSFRIPENPGGRFRLGNENDTYMEISWIQSHMLGDGPDTPNVSMTFTPAIAYNRDKASFVHANPAEAGWDFGMRQAFIEMSNFIRSAPEVVIWGGQRFYDRHDINLHDFFFDDYSGYGLGRVVR